MAKAVKNTVPAEAQISADGRSDYVVTETAPIRVAGRRVKAGDVLRMTDDEARGELLALHITPVEQTAVSNPV